MPKKKFYSVDRHGSIPKDDKKTKIGILSEDVMSYYRNVSSSLEQGFEDLDLKDEFLTNVYNTLRDEGINVSQNQTVSRILEVLFSNSKPTHMQDLFCVFCGQLTIVVFDRFASHVFQSLIQYLPAMYEERNDSGDELAWRKSFHENVKSLCGFMESHLRDVMTHTYGSHVLRSFLEALGGVHVKEDIVRSRVSRGQRKDKENASETTKTMSKSLSCDFSSSFQDITEKLIRLCNFEDHLADQNFCPVLQTVLLILSKTDKDRYQTLVSTIIEKTRLFHYDEDASVDDVASRLPDLVQNEIGSYLVELLLSLASEEQLNEFYLNLFKKRIIYFAVHPIANYVLQKMLSAIVEKQMMGQLLSDISPYMEDILAVNHIGIVTKLAEACRRTGAGQEDLLTAMMSAFHCAEPESRQKSIVPLMGSLQTYETFFGAPEEDGKEDSSEVSTNRLLKTFNYHGSVLLQQLLQFDRTTLVSGSLTELSAPELVAACCDRCGSHIVDVFFTSRTVLEKFKVTLIKKLQGAFINIACNKNGSRCLESVWKSCALKQRILIAEDLTKNHERLEGDQWGKFLYRNFALAKFSHRRKEWLDLQNATSKKKQLIKDTLEGTGGKKNKQKRKANSLQVQDNLQQSGTEDLIQAQKDAQSSRVSTEPTAENSPAVKVSKHQTKSTAEDEKEETTSEKSKKHKRKRKKDKKRIDRSESSSVLTEREIEKTAANKEKVSDGDQINKKKKKRKIVSDNDEEIPSKKSKSKELSASKAAKKKKQKSS